MSLPSLALYDFRCLSESSEGSEADDRKCESFESRLSSDGDVFGKGGLTSSKFWNLTGQRGPLEWKRTVFTGPFVSVVKLCRKNCQEIDSFDAASGSLATGNCPVRICANRLSCGSVN